MSKVITNLSDYIGILNIDLVNETAYKQFAFQIERKILSGTKYNDYGFLGAAEYNKLYADLNSNGEPQTSPYINLVNGATYTKSSGETVNFYGIKYMLNYFIYAIYTFSLIGVPTEVGLFKFNMDNREEQERKDLQYIAKLKYNDAVEYYNGDAYDYVNFYNSLFPEWDHTKKTKYLMNGIV